MKRFLKIIYAVLLLLFLSSCGGKETLTEGVKNNEETEGESQLNTDRTVESSSTDSFDTNYVLSLNAKTGYPEIFGFNLNSSYSQMHNNFISMFPRIESIIEPDEVFYPNNEHDWGYLAGDGGKLELLHAHYINASTVYPKENQDKIYNIAVSTDRIYGLPAATRWIDPQFFKNFNGDVYTGNGDLIFSIDDQLATIDFHRYNWDKTNKLFVIKLSLIRKGASDLWDKYLIDSNKITLNEARSQFLKRLVATEDEYQKAEKDKTDISDLDKEFIEQPAFHEYDPAVAESDTTVAEPDTTAEASTTTQGIDILYKDFLNMNKRDQLLYLDEYVQSIPEIDATADFLQEALLDKDLIEVASDETTVQELVSYMIK
jgi:hypothetical protein